MLRQLLIENLKKVVDRNGYAFMTGFKYRIGQEAAMYPLAWLSPLKLSKIEGRDEGIITYKAEINLLALNREASQESKEMLWTQMEKDIIAISKDLRLQPHVFDVDGLKAEPSEFTLTNQGELAMSAEFNVKMNFLCE